MKRSVFIGLVSVLLVLTACTKRKTQSVPDAKFSQYVASYTSGVISSTESIKITLARPVKIVDVPQEFPSRFLTLKPAVKGKVYLQDQYTIVFMPHNTLKNDKTYNVDFKLGELLKVPDEFKLFSFSFQTIKQSFAVEDLTLSSYPEGDIGLQKLEGKVVAADFMGTKDVQKLLSTDFNGRNLPVKFTQKSNHGRVHHFTVDSITRTNAAQKLVVGWNGKPIGVDMKGSTELEVPPLDLFKVMSARVVQKPEQYVSLHFSDPLLEDQNLNGLISIENAPDIKFRIEGNEIKLFPEHRLTGVRTITVFSGVKNSLEYTLKKVQKLQLAFEDIKPAVRMLGKGVIVPQAKGFIFPFEAVNLKAVDLRIIQVFRHNIHQFFQNNNFDGRDELKQVGRLVLSKKIGLQQQTSADLKGWNTFKIDLSTLLTIEPGAIYRIELRFRPEYSLYDCGSAEDQESETNLLLANYERQIEEEKELLQWDNPGWYSSYYYPEGYLWSERNNPCHVSYFYSDNFKSRNLFASNLGIIAKEDAGHKLYFAVTNLITAKPEEGVKLTVYNLQKQPIAHAETDAQGLAVAAPESKAFLLVAQKGDQYGYLRLDDGKALSLSNFDTSGEKVEKGIKGFIYGERGVWRPGDKLYLTFILEDKEKKLPESHPVLFELVNPQGQITTRQVRNISENGFYHFTPQTQTEAPTGNWTAKIKVGGIVFSKRIKIETVKPNRLKINLELPKKVIIAGEKQTASLQANWLHGAVAANMKTRINVNYVAKKTAFKDFKGFSFDDQAKDFYSEEQVIYEGTTDAAGHADIPIDIKKITTAPGMLRAFFTTRVFEPGGDHSIDVQAFDLAPYKRFAGIKLPDQDSRWYKLKEDYLLDVALVDTEGNPVNGKELTVEVFKINWRWWWESDEDYLGSYTNSRYHKPVKKFRIPQLNGRGKVKLNLPYRNWEDNGRYLIRVSEPETGHSSTVTAYFSRWGGWDTRSLPEGAVMLSFSSDKETYNVGEKATISIPSSKNGKALVSIENGSKVLDLFWVNTTENTTNFSFDLTPEMAPNIFVHISLIQPHAQTENDAPMRLYGIIPIMVEDPNTRLKPVVKLPDEIKPESPFKVTVSEAAGKPMTYTLAIVDEGLLDITRFNTPDPWSKFYAREALGVKTWDLYDMVNGAYGARLEKAFAIGGDEEMQAKGKKKANRFKPVVFYAGPFTLKAGKNRTHRFDMPNYIGSVKAMVVAGNQGAYGKSDATAKVRKAVMVLGTLPRVLGPGETVKLPVSVFAMKPDVKTVEVKIETNSLLKIEGHSSQTITFDEPGEQLVLFDLKVPEKLGIATLKITALGGNETATQEIELDVRNPNPPAIRKKQVAVDPGKTATITLEVPGMKGTNKAAIEISGIPPLNLERRLDYLIRYPHGCIEQTTSSVFPQLFLAGLTNLTDAQKVESADNIREALNRIQLFQLSDGSFSYWPGSSYPSEWGTSYAGHFIIKAEESGYLLPIGMKQKWLRSQRNTARNWSYNNQQVNTYYARANALQQAYRLYTLALAGEPEFGAMNRLRETTNTSLQARWRLAAAYALAGQPEVARKIVNGLERSVKPYKELAYTYGSELRDNAMILETLSLLKNRDDALVLLRDVAAALSSDRWMSTQETAYSLIAINSFLPTSGNQDKTTEFKLTANGNSEEIQSMHYIHKQAVQPDASGEVSATVTNNGEGVLFAQLTVRGIPAHGDTISYEKALKMKMAYKDMAGKALNPSSIKQGTDFYLEVAIHNPGLRGNYDELVLSTVFPSGWEIINKRLHDIKPGLKGDVPEYQDIRDDRIYTYFDLKSNQTVTFILPVNAAYQGKFYLPAISCEAMYDNDIAARKAGQWVVVKP